VVLQKLKKLIDQKYRINLVLDNLPVTAQDLLDAVSPLGTDLHVSGHELQAILPAGTYSMESCSSAPTSTRSATSETHRAVLFSVPILLHVHAKCFVLLSCSQQNEFVRPGFELGFKEGDTYYIRNHLQFNILVHPTHGEYMRARQGYKDAAVLDNVNARKLLASRQQLLDAGMSEEQLSNQVGDSSSRTLQADAPAAGGSRLCSRWCWARAQSRLCRAQEHVMVLLGQQLWVGELVLRQLA